MCVYSLQLAAESTMKLGTVRHFVLDECDKMLENLGELKKCDCNLPATSTTWLNMIAASILELSHTVSCRHARRYTGNF